MAMTGLQIYKLLPKKNCGECGPPTCLAFAMQLAQGKASLDACPYASDEAKETLGAAGAPPIKLVTIGTGDNKVSVGEETVMFRHDKTFFHETGIGISVSDALPEDEFRARLEKIKSLSFERIGMVLSVNMIALTADAGDADTFAARAAVAGEAGLPLVLISDDPGAMAQALDQVAGDKPLIYAAKEDNWEAMADLAVKHSCPLAVTGDGLQALVSLSEKVQSKGVKDLVLDPGRRDPSQALQDLTQIRKQALKKTFRPLGFPTIAFPGGSNALEEAVEASSLICKYAGLVILDHAEPQQVLPLLVLRQNIYTDPQKPIQVEPKIYPIGNAGPDSPVYLTTNFSLTYFSVLSEIETSKVPGHLIIVDTDGTSVLTSWAAGKFDSEKITGVLKESGIEETVKHRKVIIPGHLSILSGKIQDASGWEVMVGPREATGIPAYIRKNWS